MLPLFPREFHSILILPAMLSVFALFGVNSTNSPPVAADDSYTRHGTGTIGPLLANDYDPDHDPMSVLIVTYPAHASLAAGSGSLFTYTLTDPSWTGIDSFTYQACDNHSACSNIATVTVNVVNNGPVAVADFYIVRGMVTIGPLMNNDYDIDGDPLSGPDVVTYPAHGSLYGQTQPDLKWFNPAAGYVGWDSFTYRIRDPQYVWSTATVYVLILSASDPIPGVCGCPFDPSGGSAFVPGQGGFRGVASGTASATGPSAGDPVNLTTGRESYAPSPDLTVYNPTGPGVVWRRAYLGYQALVGVTGYGSPGLVRGWVHNYDVSLTATSGSWGAIKLNYPSGASETLTPQLSNGQPTGAFTTVAGAPYVVTGVSGSPTGTWQSITVTWHDQTKWKFTQFSGTTYALNQITNRTGQSLNFTWGANRTLTQVTDAGTSAVLLTLAYGSNGKLATATDIYGRQVTYTINTATSTSQSFLQSVSQVVASGTPNPPAHWTFSYTTEKGQQLNTIMVPSPTGTGNSTATINYDSAGKVTSLVDANGNQRIYTYNSGTTLVQVKDAANNLALSWTQKFDSSKRDTGITDAANHSTTIAYADATNPLRPTSVTDRNSHVTTYTYDQFGNVRTVTTSRNVTTTYTWDYTNFSLGRLASVQEGSKPATTITYYEPSGLVQTVTRPEPNNGAGTITTTYTFDSLGNLLTIVAPGNNAATTITTTLNYTTDGGYSQSAKIGQPLTVTDNLSHVTHLRYDAQGRATSATDALGNETDFSYNLIGQMDTTTYPATGQTGTGQSHTTNAYLYVSGPLTTATAFDESNVQVRQVSRSYGLEGEALSVSGSTEPVTNTYDALYRVKTLKDGNNNTTTYSYNNIGLLSSMALPGGETTQFPSYDNDGNLLQRIDGNSVVTNYLYTDSESRLTDIQYPASTSLNVHFGYDGFGRRASMTDSTGSQSYSYGNLDELLSATTTYTGLAAKTISYNYYPDGSRQTMTTPAGTFNLYFDAGGRPSSLTNPFSETTSWSYQNNNWLATQTLANGAVATYTHNALGQVTRLLNQIGGNTISDFTISYDGVGNRSSVSAGSIGTSLLNGSATFTYNTKNELLEELSTRYGSFMHDFGYDSAGNPTSFKGSTKSYNSNNQQTATGFTYDNNGNPTAYNGVSLSFDPENRLTSHGATLTAGYRGDGLRGKKQTSSGTTYFLYDGSNAVVELDYSGSIAATNTFGSRGLVSRRVSTVSVLYAFDSEGNLAQRTDANGSVLSDHLFDAHGSSLNGSLVEPFGYKAQFGYYTDNETGLHLLTNRYYDSATGRFLTRDPISYAGGINLYSHVANNPVNFADPSGLGPEEIALPVMSGGLGAAALTEVMVVAAPAVIIVGGYALEFYFFWKVGECIAEQPWNPLTHPADPPAYPTLPVPRPTPITFMPPWPPNPPVNPDRERQCEIQYENDSSLCRMLPNAGARERCWASAAQRLANCLRGLPEPPLVDH